MNEETKNIAKQLTSLSLERFTGRVDVSSTRNQSWNLFLRLGRIVWGKGGCHPNRSWQRYLKKYCPNLELEKINIISLEKFECPNYQVITALFEKKEIDKKELKGIIKNNIEDIIFDIIQQEAIENVYCEIQPEYESPVLASALKISFALVDIEETIQEAEKNWEIWQDNGLGFYHPNAAPVLKNKEQLKEEVSVAVYQNFNKLFNGNNTLRDLAFMMGINVNRISLSLVPYIRRGLLELEEIEDVETPITVKEQQKIAVASKESNGKKQKIICIDDSPQVCYIMKQIVTKIGYNFAEIQQPLYAIPKVIEEKPDLIFLDLGMPIINGYEICSQIRRISNLKNLPVIILTGQDTIVDRMRAKIVGASDFLSKPIEQNKIEAVIDKYLNYNKSEAKKQAKAGNNLKFEQQLKV